MALHHALRRQRELGRQCCLEPRDLPLGSLSLTVNALGGSGIGSQHRSGDVHVLMADGKTVKHLNNLTPPETLEAMLTIDAADAPAE